MDANVVIATLVDEAATPVARSFWDALHRSDEVIAAQVIYPECAAVLRRKVAAGLLSEAEGREKIEEALELPIAVERSTQQFRLSFEWALAMRRIKMHDLMYVAVAKIREATVVTIDSGMRQAAQEQGVPVTLLQ